MTATIAPSGSKRARQPELVERSREAAHLEKGAEDAPSQGTPSPAPGVADRFEVPAATALVANAVPAESEMLRAQREASRKTSLALNEAARALRAGVSEKDVRGVLAKAFKKEGVAQLAFEPIVASGPNALDLEYSGSGRYLAYGDLVLIDVGAKWNGYACDFTRTYPVSGGFTPQQRALYDLALEAQQQALQRLQEKPNASLQELNAHVRKFLRDGSLCALDPYGREIPMDAFFRHPLGHYVGKSFDGADLPHKTSEPIPEGVAFALETGLYVSPGLRVVRKAGHGYQDLGVVPQGVGLRLEDTFVRTADGVQVLDAGAPKTAEAVEASMR